MNSERYQIIYLHLSDGRRLKAIVPEFCKEGDALFLHPQFEVTEPKDLPDDYTWGIMPSKGESEYEV